MTFSKLMNAPAEFQETVIGSQADPAPLNVDDGPVDMALFVAAGILYDLASDLELKHKSLGDPRLLRAQLMVEELGEVVDALGKGDYVELLDGLADLAYVVGGTIDSFKLTPVFEEYFDEVHNANMSKRNADGSSRVRDKGTDWVPPNPLPYLKRLGLK